MFGFHEDHTQIWSFLCYLAYREEIFRSKDMRAKIANSSTYVDLRLYCVRDEFQSDSLALASQPTLLLHFYSS